MNQHVQVAQASTHASNNSSPPRIFKLTKPFADQAVVINLGYDQKVQVDFSAISNEKITMVHVGEKLIILFDNQSTVTIEPFFDSRHDQLGNLTIEVAPGRDLSVAEFASSFPITNDQSVLPAAGVGAGNAQASGAHFTTVGVDPLDVPPPTFGTPDTPPPPFIPATPTGQNLPAQPNNPTPPPAPPTITAGVGPALAVDESFIPGIGSFVTVPGSPTSNIASQAFAASFTVNAPAGVQSVTYALAINNATTNLIDSISGQAVTLVGKNGSSEVDGVVTISGQQVTVFTIVLDATGHVTFTELRGVHEGSGESGDVSEGAKLASGLLSLAATVTDTGNNTASASLDIGPDLTIHDDGPTLTGSGSGPTLSVDESNLQAATNGIDGTIHNGANSATASFASLFTAVTGADGAANPLHPVSYALSFDATKGSGLVDAQTGLAVVLVNNAGVIEGHVGLATGALVFTLSVDASGVVTFTDDRAVKENTASNPDTSEGISLASGAVTLTATITDNDGDSASSSIDLGKQVAFLDDGPVFGQIDSGFVPNVVGSTIIGNMTVTSGADGFATPGASLLGDTPPAGLEANGLPVNYFVDPLNPTLLIAYTGVDPTINHVFTLSVDPTNDTYTFILDQQLLLPHTDTSLAFSNAGGPVQFSVITDTSTPANDLSIVSGWNATSSFNAAQQALWLSGTLADPGTTAAHDITLGLVNASTNGIGVSNNGFDAGEFLRFDFDHPETTFANGYVPPAFSGPNVQSVTVGFNQQWNGTTDTIEYVVHLSDGSGTPISAVVSGSFHPAANSTMTFNAPSGDFINWIDIFDQSGAGKMTLNSISSVSNTGTTTLNFPVTTTDNDGDQANSSISVQVNGSGSITGSTGNDVFDGAPNEQITGNGGSDKFQLATPSQGPFTITDFSTANDIIDVSASGFGGGLSAGQVFNSTQVQTGGSSAFGADTSQRFLFDTANHTLYYSADGTTAHEQAIAILNLVAAINPANIHVHG